MMTIEQFKAFEEKAKELGYRKYPAPHRGQYAWFRSFGKSIHESDRSNYQVCFEVYDWTPFISDGRMIRDYPYSIDTMVMVSRTIDERIDLSLNANSTDIEKVEKLAEEFYKWVEKNIKL